MSNLLQQLLILTLTNLWIVHASVGNELVRTYQIGGNYHSIGSNATVISEIQTDDQLFVAVLDASNETDKYNVGYIYSDKNAFGATSTKNTLEHVNLIFSIQRDKNFYRISWDFNSLPEEYNLLNLTTQLMQICTNRGDLILTVLHVIPCESHQITTTSAQNSTFKITSQSLGYFNDEANCSCSEDGQVLYNLDGSRNKGIATCGAYAEWIGCKNVQCWSGPREVNAIQLHHDVDSNSAFNCNFVEGFPVSNYVRYRLNNETIPSSYTLKSSDNGKSFSCQVITNFTVAEGVNVESPPTTIIVYYPPENLSISRYSWKTELNSLLLLNISFMVNSKDNNITLTVTKNINVKKVSLEAHYTEDTFHIYEIGFVFEGKQDFGLYRLCVETVSPLGKACDDFIVTPRTVMSTLNVGVITGAIYLAIVFLLGIGFTLIRKRKTGIREAAVSPDNPPSELCVRHEFPEDTPGHPRYSFQEFLPPTYETIPPDYGYEVIAEFRPSHELVDGRAGYEMIDIIDSPNAYDDVQLPQSNYDDIIL